MVSDGDGLGLGAPRCHGIGAQIPEQLDELMAVRDYINQLHDLHDHIIEQLFAAGLNMQSTIASCRSPEVVERLTGTVDALQSTIEDIRATSFQLQLSGRLGSDLRQRIQDTVGKLTADRSVTTTLRFVGPTSVIGADDADHVDAVITEAVNNAIDSGASRLMIEVGIADELAVDVIDNGCGGFTDNQRLATAMQRCAEQVGGSCRIAAPLGVC